MIAIDDSSGFDLNRRADHEHNNLGVMGRRAVSRPYNGGLGFHFLGNKVVCFSTAARRMLKSA